VPDLVIQSHRGPYQVRFGALFEGLENGLQENEHLLIDTKVASAYHRPLAQALTGRSVLKIEATETNKSLEKIPGYITHLLEKSIRRDHTLVVVGGGIIQDIAAFIASCLLRGIAWRYYPTTLLAQADSCIGSKSSINVGRYKNQVGTFTPPSDVRISMDVLDTLSVQEIRSGIGEMIKVHVIAGWEDTRRIAQDYPRLLTDRALLASTLRRSLEIKKVKIELDEFDRKERLIMNYGHTFGHALESATDYAIPHGIAVTLGMDLANYTSLQTGLINRETFDELHDIMTANFGGFEQTPVPEGRFFDALTKDKKNQGQDISLILLRGPGEVFLKRTPNDASFQQLCRTYFQNVKAKVAV
jgi:3-dehydroquinate synthase